MNSFTPFIFRYKAMVRGSVFLLGILFLLVAGCLTAEAQHQRLETLQSIEESLLQKYHSEDQRFKSIASPVTNDSLKSVLKKLKTDPIKCGFPLLMEFDHQQEQLSAETVEAITTVRSRSFQSEFSYDSPSGKFRIFYDTSGDHAVPTQDQDSNGIPDYVDWVAAAADSSWRHEIQTLGYSDPVSGNTDPYPIFLEQIGFYGYTDYGDIRGYPNSTFIVVNSELDDPLFHDNDDTNKTHGAIKVTVAHELKHAIQFANSEWYVGPLGIESPHSISWSEMDATYMEEVVYDNVNDYYNYITRNPSIFLSERHNIPAAYYAVTWFIFVEEFYDEQVWVELWNHIKEVY